MSVCLARALCVAHLVVVASTCASAQEPVEPISLHDAVEKTLVQSPELRSFGYRLRAQSARAATAALRPPLELRGDIEDFLGSGRTSGLDAAEETFSISRVIELGDKREQRIAVGEAAADLITIERAAAELDVVAEVTRRFIHVAADEAQLELTRRATELARETLAATEQRVAAARAPDVERSRARVTVARATIEQEHAEHELAAARRKLAAMWGDSEATFGRVDADLFALPEIETFAALADRVAQSPNYLRFVSEARLRDAEIRLAESRSRSDLSLSAGIRHLEETDDNALVFGISMPLGRSERAQASVAETQALRGEIDAEREAHAVRVAAELFAIHQELQHAITEAETLRSTVLPEMQSALAATRAGFEQGRFSYLEWVDAQRELVDVARALIEAAANAHLYFAEIERLTGEPLAPANR